jgi:predicted XRE-type DNA-binding protein
MSNRIKVEQGSGNIFKDLGFTDEVAEEELLKVQLGAEIFRILDERGLTQAEAAKLLGVKQPEIARLKAAKLSYYSVERLMRFLERLNCEVSIHISPQWDDTERVIAL